jgi:hypothetical protein
MLWLPWLLRRVEGIDPRDQLSDLLRQLFYAGGNGCCGCWSCSGWLLWLLWLLSWLLWLLGKVRGNGVAHEDGQGDAVAAAGLELGIELVGQADHDAVGCRHRLPACKDPEGGEHAAEHDKDDGHEKGQAMLELLHHGLEHGNVRAHRRQPAPELLELLVRLGEGLGGAERLVITDTDLAQRIVHLA